MLAPDITVDNIAAVNALAREAFLSCSRSTDRV